MGRIAAIDYGEKRIGIALSDEKKKLALPFTTVEGGGKRAVEGVCRALAEKKKEIEFILIGLPLLLNGEKGDMARRVEQFAQELKVALQLPVLLWDERLSSKQAEVQLLEISLNRKKRNAKIDEVAAALLLQSYLDFYEEQKKPLST